MLIEIIHLQCSAITVAAILEFVLLCTLSVYLVLISHVSSTHHIKYLYSLDFDENCPSNEILGVIC